MTQSTITTHNDYKILLQDIVNLLEEGKKSAYSSMNTLLLQTYRRIGRRIVEFEQGGNTKAKYGKELLINLSKELKRI